MESRRQLQKAIGKRLSLEERMTYTAPYVVKSLTSSAIWSFNKRTMINVGKLMIVAAFVLAGLFILLSSNGYSTIDAAGFAAGSPTPTPPISNTKPAVTAPSSAASTPGSGG